MSPDILLLILAFILGLSFSQTRLCTVACVQALVVERRLDGLMRTGIAVGAAAIVLLLGAWLWPERVGLPANLSMTWHIALGGLLLGIGALVNGACYLGSIMYLTTGNTSFLFTLFGILVGSRFGSEPWGETMAMEHGMRHAMGSLWLAALAVFAGLMILGLVKSRDSPRMRYATVATGAIAGVIFARQPDWSYGSVLDALAHADMRPVDWLANLPALVLFGGAIFGAFLSNRLRFRAPALTPALRCLAGGILLGYGASLIPGGNDTLLLWSIPGLTAYGVLAFAVMATTIGVAVWVGQKARPSSAPAS